jgi:hypothetical protein
VEKYIAILILILVPAVASASGGVLRGIMMAQNTDTTAPTVSSATIGTNGTTLTINLTENSTRNGGTFDVDCSTAGNNITATYSSGSGSSSLAYTLGTTVNSGDTCNLDYDGASNGIEDGAGNDLAAITNGTVTNNSTQGGYGDILFWWRAESTTLSSGDYPSSGTITLNSDSVINATAAHIGSNGLSCSTTWDSASIATTDNNLVSSTAGRVGMWLYIGSDSANGSEVFRYTVGSNAVYFYLINTSYLSGNYSNGSNHYYTDTAISLDTWQFVEFYWDTTGGHYGIVIDNTAATASITATAFDGAGSGTMSFGKNGGTAGTMYIDNVGVSNDYTRSLYSLRNNTTSPR